MVAGTLAPLPKTEEAWGTLTVWSAGALASHPDVFSVPPGGTLTAFARGAGSLFAVLALEEAADRKSSPVQPEAALSLRTTCLETIRQADGTLSRVIHARKAFGAACCVRDLARPAAKSPETLEPLRTGQVSLERQSFAALTLPLTAKEHAEAQQGLGRECSAGMARLALEVRLALAREAAAAYHPVIKNAAERPFTIVRAEATPLISGQ